MRCQRPGCPGRLVDGYCDVCGLPAPSGVVAPATPPSSPLPPTPPRPVGPAPTPPLGRAAAFPPAAVPYQPAGPGRPVQPAGRPSPVSERCQAPGCAGSIEDGYCTICGAPAGPVAGPPATALAAPLTSRLSTTALGSARLRSGAVTVSVSRVTTSNRLRSGHLGAGLTEVPVEPAGDPAAAILTDPTIPEERRVCPSCG
ncbi:MAG: hypothetical protein LBL55_01275, partial [Propionibacteriaceae bacterium]|nr:hypothetical protein [Propionibacteriaceae bacterium]